MSERARCDPKFCAEHHRMHIWPNGRNVYEVEIAVVGHGPRAYVWLGDKDGKPVGFLSGPATLRKLAHAILEEVGE